MATRNSFAILGRPNEPGVSGMTKVSWFYLMLSYTRILHRSWHLPLPQAANLARFETLQAKRRLAREGPRKVSRSEGGQPHDLPVSSTTLSEENK